MNCVQTTGGAGGEMFNEGTYSEIQVVIVGGLLTQTTSGRLPPRRAAAAAVPSSTRKRTTRANLAAPVATLIGGCGALVFRAEHAE